MIFSLCPLSIAALQHTISVLPVKTRASLAAFLSVRITSAPSHYDTSTLCFVLFLQLLLKAFKLALALAVALPSIVCECELARESATVYADVRACASRCPLGGDGSLFNSSHAHACWGRTARRGACLRLA
eukprot:5667846-Pleurochrysis_carterae.AAC.1